MQSFMNRYYFKCIVIAGMLSAAAVSGCGGSSNSVEMPANPEPAPGAPTGVGTAAGDKSATP